MRPEQGSEYRASEDPIFRQLVCFEGTVQTPDAPVGAVGVAEENLANGLIVRQASSMNVRSDGSSEAISVSNRAPCP